VPDSQWCAVTLDSGLTFVVGGGWSLPPGYPNFSTTWIEMVGTEGAVMVDDTHRDVVLNTMKSGMQLPMSTMPGEAVDTPTPAPWRRRRCIFWKPWRSTSLCW
jgi:scyllo-inositol 2-dehydrogenase (NAD+)